MDRRHFLTASAVTVAAATATAAPRSAPPAEQVTITKPDGLNPPGIRTGGVKLVPVVGGKYKVWTKKIGSGPIKVLLLHGGPGFTHEYLEAMESFLPQAGIEMYYYDQLGCGNSDQPDDPSLWTLPRYLEEVEEVRKGLGLDNFVLYGHSWGGVLAIEYALYHQRHLRGLVISNMTAGIQSLLRHLDVIKQQLPPATLASLQKLEAAQAYDAPEYEQIMMEHHAVAGCGGAGVPSRQPEDLQPDAGQERVPRHRQPEGLGTLGPPARNQGTHADHRRQIRRDGPGGHEKDGEADATRELSDLRRRQPSVHVGCAGLLFRTPDQIPENRLSQAKEGAMRIKPASQMRCSQAACAPSKVGLTKLLNLIDNYSTGLYSIGEIGSSFTDSTIP